MSLQEERKVNFFSKLKLFFPSLFFFLLSTQCCFIRPVLMISALKPAFIEYDAATRRTSLQTLSKCYLSALTQTVKLIIYILLLT